jgi:hypothetical protein
MGCHLVVGANSFARKWFVPIARANKFAPTDPLTEEFKIVHALLTWKSATLAAYSKHIVATLSRELTPPCGWGEWELEV